MRKGLIVLVISGFVLSWLLSDRLYFVASTGGRGVVGYMGFVQPFLLALYLFSASPKRSVGTLPSFFALGLGAYLSLSLVLPILGVILEGYPARSLFSLVSTVSAIGYFLLGYLFSREREAERKLIRNFITSAVVLEATYGILLYAESTGVIHFPFLRPLLEWETLSQLTYSADYRLSGRAVGTYVNPNVFGFLSAISFWWVALMCRSGYRVVFGILTLAALIMSDSRGAIVALLVSVVAYIVYAGSWKTKGGRMAQLRISLIVTLAVGLPVAYVLLGTLRVDDVFSPRIVKGSRVLAEGAAVDENLDARIDTWGRAIDFCASRPFGTLGSPELLFGGYIDNEILRAWMQGGALFALSYIYLLLGGSRFVSARRPEARFVGLTSVVILVDSITAMPLASHAGAIFWLFSGYCQQVSDVPSMRPLTSRGDFS
jgi:hypothetical protein